MKKSKLFLAMSVAIAIFFLFSSGIPSKGNFVNVKQVNANARLVNDSIDPVIAIPISTCDMDTVKVIGFDTKEGIITGYLQVDKAVGFYCTPKLTNFKIYFVTKYIFRKKIHMNSSYQVFKQIASPKCGYLTTANDEYSRGYKYTKLPDEYGDATYMLETTLFLVTADNTGATYNDTWVPCRPEEIVWEFGRDPRYC